MYVDVPRRRWTREEYYRAAEAGVFRPDERLELVGGEVIPMTPQSSHHAAIIWRLEDMLREALGTDFDVRPQRQLDFGELSQPEPDISVVEGSRQDYEAAHPTTAVLVVEASDTTLSYVRGPKASLYASAGIPEYWLVNMAASIIEVYRDPVEAPDALFGMDYRVRSQHRTNQTVTPLAAPNVSIAVSDILR